MLCLSGFELYSRWVPLTIIFVGLRHAIIDFPILLIASCESQHVAIIMQSYILMMLTHVLFSKKKKIFRYKMLLNKYVHSQFLTSA